MPAEGNGDLQTLICVEGRTEVKQAEQRHFLTIGGGVDVGQDAQERRLCRMVPAIR